MCGPWHTVWLLVEHFCGTYRSTNSPALRLRWWLPPPQGQVQKGSAVYNPPHHHHLVSFLRTECSSLEPGDQIFSSKGCRALRCDCRFRWGPLSRRGSRCVWKLHEGRQRSATSLAICRRNNVDTRVLSQEGLREGKGGGTGEDKRCSGEEEGREQLKYIC